MRKTVNASLKARLLSAASLVALLLFAVPVSATNQCTSGDCNGDGRVSIVDVLVAAQASVGLVQLGSPLEDCCNVRGSHTVGQKVDIFDALLIAQYDLGFVDVLSSAEDPALLLLAHEGEPSYGVWDTAPLAAAPLGPDAPSPAELRTLSPSTGGFNRIEIISDADASRVLLSPADPFFPGLYEVDACAPHVQNTAPATLFDDTGALILNPPNVFDFSRDDFFFPLFYLVAGDSPPWPACNPTPPDCRIHHFRTDTRPPGVFDRWLRINTFEEAHEYQCVEYTPPPRTGSAIIGEVWAGAAETGSWARSDAWFLHDGSQQITTIGPIHAIRFDDEPVGTPLGAAYLAGVSDFNDLPFIMHVDKRNTLTAPQQAFTLPLAGGPTPDVAVPHQIALDLFANPAVGAPDGIGYVSWTEIEQGGGPAHGHITSFTLDPARASLQFGIRADVVHPDGLTINGLAVSHPEPGRTLLYAYAGAPGGGLATTIDVLDVSNGIAGQTYDALRISSINVAVNTPTETRELAADW